MAWVTKSSEETYTPDPPPREYTPKEKASNWWHYNKIIVAVVIIVLGLIAWTVHDVLSQEHPDLRIAYVGAQVLPDETVTALEEALIPYCTDRNGDGEVLVRLSQYNLSFDTESQNTDPYTQMAAMTQLNANMAADTETFLYLLADPAGFQESVPVLQYRDGTLPAEEESGNWQQMVYRWADCPVLAGLDLGEFTIFGDTEEQQFSSQELLAPLYLGCSGDWHETNSQAYQDSLALWNALTAGAVPPAEG